MFKILKLQSALEKVKAVLREWIKNTNDCLWEPKFKLLPSCNIKITSPFFLYLSVCTIANYRHLPTGPSHTKLQLVFLNVWKYIQSLYSLLYTIFFYQPFKFTIVYLVANLVFYLYKYIKLPLLKLQKR